MITIKSDKGNKYGGAELKIEKGTPYTTILLGAEMLIECLVKEHTPNNDINWVLDDIKRIYERDNKEAMNVNTTNKKEMV